MKSTLLIILLMFVLSDLNAGGFLTYLAGNRQAGMGATGVGYATDAAIISFNPGGLAMLRGNNLYGGMHLILARTNWIAPQPSSSTASMESSINTPFQFYGNYGILDSQKLQLGLGVYTPFGSSVSWPDDWEGRMIIQNISLRTLFIQPTLSYALSDKISIGAGFIYATGNIGLRRSLPIMDHELNESSAILNGNAKGIGYNAGLYIKPSNKLSFGISYRSNVLFRIDDGDVNFLVPASLTDSFPATSFASEIKLPFVASAGMAIDPVEDLTFTVDVNYTGWSSYDSLVFDYDRNTSILQDTRSAKNFENSFTFRIGIEYRISEMLMVRVGGYYDLSPVPEGYLSPETPDSDRMGLTAGIGFAPTSRLSINGSMIYIEGAKRTDMNIETGFGGTYKSKIAIPGISVQYSF